MTTTRLFLMASHYLNLYRLVPAMRIKASILCALPLLFPAITHACDLPAWQARYNITKYGTTIARVDMSLRNTRDNAQYLVHTTPSGFLAMISSEEMTDTSDLKRAANNTWQLEKFSQQRVKDTHRNQQFSLQQTDNTFTAKGESDGKPFNIKVQPPVWDRSSAQLALTCDLLAENKPRAAYDYTIIDNGNIVTYHFEFRSEEKIRIADKQFNTLKFERSSGDRSTFFWLDPEQHFMLVRMEQHKKGSLHLRMNLDLPDSDLP
jgi:Protein of unknown function (DUF3108)